MEKVKNKRITVKLRSPNPLFEKWLLEWRDEASEKNSKMQFTFNIALKSLRKYPIPLNSGKECLILKGFGQKLCDMLDQKLKTHKENMQNNLDATVDYQVDETPPKTTKSKKKASKASPKTSKSYIPAPRSGPYAILLALLKMSQDSKFPITPTKAEIIQIACQYCDKSFTKAEPGSFYTAWSSMGTLVSKKLVNKTENPPKFSLTTEGYEVAFKLLDSAEDNVENDNDLANEVVATVPGGSKQVNSEEEPVLSQQSQVETFIFAPGTFDVILLVDNQETEGKKFTELDDDTKYELNQTKVKYEIRHLKVGDFTWICRDKNTNNELVLPYIVERKRMDDLSRSITDGRFHEQKIRLKQTGIPNLIYVIENISQRQKMVKNDKIGALPISTLEQAAANTLVQDGFQVKYTNCHRHTMAYLATFTRFLTKYYSGKTVMSTTKDNLSPQFDLSDDLIPLLIFKNFNKSSSKQKDLTVREMFIKQLVQLKGLSVDKAIAITNVFSTPRLLLDEYEKIDKQFAPLLLSKISYGPWKRTIGAVISKILYQFYTQDHLL